MSKDYDTSYRQFSVFREETSHGVGDPYQDAWKNGSSRYGGKQFGVRALVKGRMPDVYLDKEVRSLGDGDQYLDAIDLEREFQQMVGGKNISEKAFFPPKNIKHSACPGAIEPCLGPMGLLAEDWHDKPRTKDPVQGKKKIYTSPIKKGGFGYGLAERTIGGKPPSYAPDEYQRGRILGKELRKVARQRIPKAFNSAPNSGSGLFTTNPYQDPPGPTYVVKKEASKAISRPWRPSHPPHKAAFEQPLSKVGRDYMPDPVREPEYVARGTPGLLPFKPCAGVKERLSMKTVNPYVCDPRPPPNMDFALVG